MKKKTCDRLVDGILYYWGEAVDINGKVDSIANNAFEDYVRECGVYYDGSDLGFTAYGLTNSQKRVLFSIMRDVYETYS